MDARKSIERLGVVTLGVNLAVMTVKIAGGVFGNCYALVADGIESASDILTSLITWGGYHLSLAPADRKHPYGHGRIESMAGVFSGLSLVAAAVLIASHEIAVLMRGAEPGVDPARPAWWTLLILAGVIIAKETLSRTIFKSNRSVSSVALEGDAWHHRTDAITSAIAAFGIVLALVVPGLDDADDYAAMVMSLIIFINGAQILRKAFNELMDAAVTNDLGDFVRARAQACPGVMAVEKCRVRQSGTDFFIEVHLCVDPAMTVECAHQLGHQVKEMVRAARPAVADVVVHLEPYHGPIDPARER